MEIKGVSMEGGVMKKLSITHNCFREKLLNKSNTILVDGEWKWDDETSYGDALADAMDEDQPDAAVALETTTPTAAETKSSSAPTLPSSISECGYSSHDVMLYLHRIETHVAGLRTDFMSLSERDVVVESSSYGFILIHEDFTDATFDVDASGGDDVDDDDDDNEDDEATATYYDI